MHEIARASITENCIGKQNCSISIGRSHLSKIMNPECQQKFENGELSNYLVVVASCYYNSIEKTVFGKHISKKQMGFLVVVLNLLNMLVIARVINGLKQINGEYVDCLDNQLICITDFCIRLKKVRIDRNSQNRNIIKLKIWHHLNAILFPYKNAYNDMKIVDIELSSEKDQKV